MIVENYKKVPKFDNGNGNVSKMKDFLQFKANTGNSR